MSYEFGVIELPWKQVTILKKDDNIELLAINERLIVGFKNNSEICTCGFIVVFEDFTKNQLILASSEWIFEYCYWVKVHV